MGSPGRRKALATLTLLPLFANADPFSERYQPAENLRRLAQEQQDQAGRALAARRAIRRIVLSGQISGHDVELSAKNENRFPIKDVTIECERVGRSGTVMANSRRQLTIYDIAQPGKTISAKLAFFAVDLEQPYSIRCGPIAVTSLNTRK